MGRNITGLTKKWAKKNIFYWQIFDPAWRPELSSQLLKRLYTLLTDRIVQSNTVSTSLGHSTHVSFHLNSTKAPGPLVLDPLEMVVKHSASKY